MGKHLQNAPLLPSRLIAQNLVRQASHRSRNLLWALFRFLDMSLELSFSHSSLLRSAVFSNRYCGFNLLHPICTFSIHSATSTLHPNSLRMVSRSVSDAVASPCTRYVVPGFLENVRSHCNSSGGSA